MSSVDFPATDEGKKKAERLKGSQNLSGTGKCCPIHKRKCFPTCASFGKATLTAPTEPHAGGKITCYRVFPAHCNCALVTGEIYHLEE